MGEKDTVLVWDDTAGYRDELFVQYRRTVPDDEVGLRWMTGVTDESFQYHYIETFNAWNVMRAQIGRAPYPWEKFLDRDEYDYTHGIRERPSAGG
jgi:hypothetical protein